jgi:hypothetical protein
VSVCVSVCVCACVCVCAEAYWLEAISHESAIVFQACCVTSNIVAGTSHFGNIADWRYNIWAALFSACM